MKQPETIFRAETAAAIMVLGGVYDFVESPNTSPGIPDVLSQFGQDDLWLELKVTRMGEVEMRPAQRRWHRRRHDSGGKSWVLIKDRGTDSVMAIPGHIAADLRSHAHYWLEAAKQHGHVAPMGMLSAVIETLVKDIRNEQQSSDRSGTPQVQGSTVSPLPPSGGDVAGHHWLTGKP